jgi:hypothetical protein
VRELASKNEGFSKMPMLTFGPHLHMVTNTHTHTHTHTEERGRKEEKERRQKNETKLRVDPAVPPAEKTRV